MDTTLSGAGSNSNIEAQIDPTHQAIRANLKPLEHIVNGKQGGHYFMSMLYSNTVAKPAAGSDVFSLRWTDTNMLLVLKRITIQAVITTGYTAAGAQDFSIYKATGFSVSPSAGTQIIPSTASQKARSSNMAASGLGGASGVLWVSSGDLLTTGTRTLDTQPFGYCQLFNGTTVGSGQPMVAQVLYEIRDFGVHPIILSQNEGLVIQTPIGNAQAAGVSKFGITMEWAEVSAY